MTFQELLFTLQKFWGERGCAIVQPYDVEVGAGTMHPATALRSLGPEPWNVRMCSLAAAPPTDATPAIPSASSATISIRC